MKEILFVKFNQSRAPKYATKTVVFAENGVRGVYKEPVGEEANIHLETFNRKYELTKDIFPQISCLPCKVEGVRVYYDFIKGRTLDDEIAPLINDPEAFEAKIKELLATYYGFNESLSSPFEMTDSYKELFGEIDLTGMDCIRPANLDMIFDNVILTENGAVAYDYEWVYDFAIPKKYVIYRVLSRAYDKYASVLIKHFSFEEFVRKFNITETEREVFARLEQALIQSIFGEAHAYNDFAKYVRKERPAFEAEDEKTAQIEELQDQVEQLALQANELNNEINNMIFSRSWKVTRGLRKFTEFARNVKHEGINYFIPRDTYELIPTKAQLAEQRNTRFDYEPLISVITPLFNTEKKYLEELIESVLNQTYGNFEICFGDFSDDDHSAEVKAVVYKYARRDSRVHYQRELRNRGIAENTNRVIETARGDYLALLDHDDVLHPCAFYEVVKAINEQQADFIYTDEVKFSKRTRKPSAPYFKPDFNADQLRVQNYICHLNVYKMSLLRENHIRYDDNFNGSQDHDIVLRLTEKAQHIVHIPKVLYYWRVHAASVASNINAKPYCTTSGINAINAQYERMGENLRVKSSYMNIPRYRVIAPKKVYESLRVVVWNGTDHEVVNATVSSIRMDVGCDFEVTVIKEAEDQLSPNRIFDLLSTISEEYVLFVRAGVTVETPRTVSELFTYVRREGCAAAECKIITPEGTIFNGGIYSSGRLDPKVRSYGYGWPKDEVGYEAMLHHGRAVSAVSGLFTLVKVSDYKQLPAGKTVGANPFIATSFHAAQVHKSLFFTPYVYCVTEAFQPKYIGNYEGDAPDRDPYFNDNILKYNLA